MYKVSVNYKIVDAKSSKYGELVEKAETFMTFSEAMVAVRDFQRLSSSRVILLGNPTVEEVQLTG